MNIYFSLKIINELSHTVGCNVLSHVTVRLHVRCPSRKEVVEEAENMHSGYLLVKDEALRKQTFTSIKWAVTEGASFHSYLACMCMYVSVFVCLYVCVFRYQCIYMYITHRQCVCLSVCLLVAVWLSLYVWLLSVGL